MRNVKKRICVQLGVLSSFTPVNTWSVTAESIDMLAFQKLEKLGKKHLDPVEMSERSFTDSSNSTFERVLSREAVEACGGVSNFCHDLIF